MIDLRIDRVNTILLRILQHLESSLVSSPATNKTSLETRGKEASGNDA